MTDTTPTVLVVDDEPDVVDVYELVLSEDCDVLKAYDGEEALDVVDESVDVVLLDRRMPGLSGADVLAELRERALDVRVALVTAVDPDFDVARMDFDAYVTKPVDEATLEETVEELVALSTYDDRVRERFVVARKQALLESEKTRTELADSEAYAELERRRAELDEQLTEAVGEMDADTFAQALTDAAEDTDP